MSLRDSDAWREFQDRRDRHDERLDRQDRLAEVASLPFWGVHLEQPSERERRLHRAGEHAARRLYRKPTDSQVGPAHPVTRKAA